MPSSKPAPVHVQMASQPEKALRLAQAAMESGVDNEAVRAEVSERS